MSFPNGTRNLKQQWCMFFDLLKVKYVTSPFAIPIKDVNGYERYRPDFYLPQNNLLISIVDERQQNKAIKVAHVDSQIEKAVSQQNSFLREFRAVCIFSTPIQVQNDVELNVHFKSENQCGGSDYANYKFCMCPDCGAIGFEYDGRGERVCTGHAPIWGDHINHWKIYRHEEDFSNLSHGDKGYSGHHRKIIAAANKASVHEDDDALIE